MIGSGGATIFQDVSDALKNCELVRAIRAGLPETRPYSGFVVGASRLLVLFHVLSDRLDLDGYGAVRLADITDLQRDFDVRAFYLKALELKNERPSIPSGIDLTDTRSLIQSVQEHYPLVVFHREAVAPHECEIGRVKLTTENTYALHWISPSAVFEKDSESYRYSDVTRVEFDGEYENTLALVAGLLPAKPVP